jgi:hypothetical protein
MKQVLFLGGLMICLFSCSNNSGSTDSAGTIKDTNKAVMTNSGAATTGGEGAGFGTGGAGISDTGTKAGNGNDKTKAEKHEQKK